MKSLNNKQMHVLAMMKNEIDANPLLCKHSDSTILRFLAANDFEIADAVDALAIYDKWKYNFASIMNKSDVDLFKSQLYPFGMCNTDKLKHPLYIHCIGKIKMLEAPNEEKLFKSICYDLEYALDHIFPQMLTDKIVLIIDLSDILVKAVPKLILRPIKNVIEKLSLFYPEIIHKGFIINPTDTFGLFWDALTSNLSKKSVGKFKFIKTPFNESFLQMVALDSLPLMCYGKSTNVVSENKGPWIIEIDSPPMIKEPFIEEPEEKKQSSIEAKLSELENEIMGQVTEFKFNEDSLKPPVAETPLNTEQNEDEEDKNDVV